MRPRLKQGFALLLLFCLSALAAAQSDDLALKSHRAKALMAEGRFSEAVPLYEQLVRAVPDNPGLILNLGLAERMAGQFRKSIPHFEAVLKKDPGNLPACLSLGVVHLKLGEPGLAVAPLERAAAAAAGDAEPRGLLAQALLEAGRPKEAALHFRKLTGLTPGDARAWYGLGKSYESVSNNAFEQLRKSEPESCWMLALLADSRVTRKQYRSAFYLYRQALERNPAMGGVHTAVAEVYRRTGHPDWAADEQSREPAKPAALNAAYREAKENSQLALEAFSHLSSLPESVEYHQLRAETMSAQGQHLDAAKEWRAALAMQPGNAAFEKEVAVSLYMGRDYNSAAPLILRFRPLTPELNYMEGDSLLHLEEAERAIPYLEAAVRADPKMTAAHASLGLAYARAGQPAKAVSHLEAASSLDDDGSLTYQLSRAYQATGQPERARQALKQYEEMVKKVQAQKDELSKEAQITAPPDGRQ
uniref:Tetratricopeptide TPR_2 repeat protein n=1 Tax=Solibacter usitatus (strain Ellin6076) TaxID=234267 RepID=Q01TF8_SOLUE